MKRRNVAFCALGIIHVFAIECHDVVEHALGLDGRAVGVEVDGPDVAVNSVMPLSALAVGVALKVIVLCGLWGFKFHVSGIMCYL